MRPMCSSTDCRIRVFGLFTKIAVTALTAGLVVMLQLSQIFRFRNVQNIPPDFYYDVLFFLWIAVWILTIIMPPVVNSVGLPGKVVGLFNALSI